jgi:ADP-heptose:LPS heptosyltransferase
MVSRNLRLIGSLGISVPKIDDSRPSLPEPKQVRHSVEQILPKSNTEKTIGLHIGSPLSQYDKIWPAKNWGLVCELMASRYKIRFVLVGGKDEAANLQEFKIVFKNDSINLIGRTTLLQAFSVIRRCDLFLSNDTGLAKAAMALDIPSATVWGPSDRPGYGIVWNPDRHLEILHEVPCAPCVRMGLRQEGSGVINFTNCGHHACLTELKADDVFKAISNRYDSLLKNSA